MRHEMIKHINISPDRRVIFISDIHGHLAHFNSLLEKINFSENDLLIVVGDTVERGPATLAALRRVMGLEKQNRCITLSGNWDYYMHFWLTTDDPKENAFLLKRTLEMDAYYGSSIFADMCRELNIPLTPETDVPSVMPLVRRRFAEEIAFLGNMPIMLDAGAFVCVHGGTPTLDEAEISKMDPYSLLKNDSFATQGHAFNRWVMTGHWPVANYDEDIARFSPHIFPESKIIALDGGCGTQEAAQLNALIMQDSKFEWAFTDDFPRVTALDPQSPSENPLHTVWNTRFIDVLEKNGAWAKVLHHATGKILEVPTQRLWMQGDTEVLGDFTDYALPVAPGDTLSILIETDRGLYCKKADISGWYYGRYEKQ